MFGGDPALALKIFARFQLAGGRKAALRHGIVHTVQQERNPTAVTLQES